MREKLSAGQDPLAVKEPISVLTPTFGELADQWIVDRASSVRSEKSVARWKRLLGPKGPAGPLRKLNVDQVETKAVIDALSATWEEKPSHAIARAYIEAVLDRAKVQGHRFGENPARWAGHLETVLSKPKHLSRGHHAALAFNDLPKFMSDLRIRPATAARALEFTILTAARSGESLGALWSEIDLEEAVWRVPGHRMKTGREHLVTLSNPAVELLHLQSEMRTDDHVFPGNKLGRPLSGMSMEMLMRRMEQTVTVHGFRSTFRTWVSDHTQFQREVAEVALAHKLGGVSEQAYDRAIMLDKRRALMAAWAIACGYVAGDRAERAINLVAAEVA